MKRKDLIKASGLVAAGLGITGRLKAGKHPKHETATSFNRAYPFQLPTAPLTCIFVPSENLGLFLPYPCHVLAE